MSIDPNRHPPFPPFIQETAVQKVRMAEDAWNTREPEQVSLAYTVDSIWETARSFCQDENLSSNFCAANGRSSWTTA